MTIRGLCVPSMGENQKGFKSPVYRMNIRKMKRTTRSQLREGDRAWGGRLWESHQPTNRNLIRGRRNGTSWHNTAKFPHFVSAPHSRVADTCFACSGGKWGGWVAEVFAITWGDLSGFASRESGERPAWKHVG